MIPCASFDRSGLAETAGSTTWNSSPPRRPTCPCSPTSSVSRSAKPQQSIPRRVAKRIVDGLESVEVEQEHRAAVLPPDCAHQGIVERPAKGFAVGEASQRILAREPVELDLGLPHLGQVGSKAAKAEEVAELIVHRPARDRPPDLVLGLGADNEVLERDVRRQIEAKRPFGSCAAVGSVGRDEVGERPFEQIGGLTSHRSGDAVADVRQCSVARGLPEPSSLAILEFLDEPLGSCGLRTRVVLGRIYPSSAAD